MQCKSVCIFPVDANSIPLISNLHILHSEYIVKYAVGFSAYSHISDISVLRNRLPVGIQLVSNLQDALGKCDVLLIPDKQSDLFMYSDDFFDLLRDEIYGAIVAKKSVICFSKIPKEILEEIKDFSKDSSKLFRYIPGEVPLDDWSLDNEISVLYKPIAPVVFLGSMVPNTDSFEILLWLVGKLRSNGYKVSVISDTPYDSFFEFHSLPHFSANADLNNVTWQYNMMFSKIERIEHPDVFIVLLPGAMLKFDDNLIGDFGISSYMISQAIVPNYFVFCSLYGYFDVPFWRAFSENLSYRMGYEIDYIHMGNVINDTLISQETKKFSFSFENSLECMIKIKQFKADINIFSYLDESSQEKFYQDLIVELFQKNHII